MNAQACGISLLRRSFHGKQGRTLCVRLFSRESVRPGSVWLMIFDGWWRERSPRQRVGVECFSMTEPKAVSGFWETGPQGPLWGEGPASGFPRDLQHAPGVLPGDRMA